MAQSFHGRRDLFRVALATTLGAAAASGPTRARAADTGMVRTGIDGALRRAVDAREVPGVVAMAATDKGVTNCCPPAVIRPVTVAPRSRSRRIRSSALNAAMPPPITRRMRLPESIRISSRNV